MKKLILLLLCLPSLCLADNLCDKLKTPQTFSDHFEAYTLTIQNEKKDINGIFTEAATNSSATVFGLCQYNRLWVRLNDKTSGQIKGMLVYNPNTKLTELLISDAKFKGAQLKLRKMTANID